MDLVPITFTHNTRTYTGYFHSVQGAGGTAVFHLNINGFYSGRLRYSEFDHGWVFDPTPKTEDWVNLADYFGDYVTAWYE